MPDLVVVTGSGRGIGRAVALDLGRYTRVLCISRSLGCSATAAEIIKAGGKATAQICDFRNHASITNMIFELKRFFTHYDRIGVVCAAAALGPESKDEFQYLDWLETFSATLLGNLAVFRTLLATMRASSFGRLVMFAGGGAAYGYPKFPAYAACKTAVVRTVENIDIEMQDLSDFSAVALAPGAVDTGMLQQVRAAGGEVKTVTDISEPVKFVREFIESPEAWRLSGRFVHVRDDWRAVLSGGRELGKDQWMLRRVE